MCTWKSRSLRRLGTMITSPMCSTALTKLSNAFTKDCAVQRVLERIRLGRDMSKIAGAADEFVDLGFLELLPTAEGTMYVVVCDVDPTESVR